jgi:hypothetical protein
LRVVQCVDHIVVLGETHLRRVLKSYAGYYNETRTHRSLDKDTPISRPVQRIGSIISHALLGVDCITTTSESEFLVHTKAKKLPINSSKQQASLSIADFINNIDPKRTFDLANRYFVIRGLRRGGGLGVDGAGEITNVTQVFQPSGRFSAANSL